jgi:DNA-binding response OmpR family regulator
MKRTVLVVDDSLTVRMDVADAFESAGFRPILCASVAEAREALAAELISVAILDVLLPDGNGVELLREIRNNPQLENTPVMMLSSEAEVQDRIHGLQTGADDYVGKPYDINYVVARAVELLRVREGSISEDRITVLVVDDSQTFREELRSALQGAGYVVLTAENGEEGLRVAASTRPNAILVDGVMPDMDGATVIRRIRLDAALRGIACILLTASEDGRAELRALDAGADAFVRKEEEVSVILARLGAVLRNATKERGDVEALLGPRRVLAVDDSATYLQELASALRSDGYDVLLARSGEQALEMLSVQRVDCVLLDLIMPGLGGRETCRQIKTSGVARDIPLIMVTAVEDRQTMIESLSLGADDFISKSSDFQVLRARVRAQIRRKQFEDEHRRVREELLRSELEATEARAARRVAETKLAMTEELERKNRELEAFSYSVSHDLRAPLRSIDGFSRILHEEYGDCLDQRGQDYLKRVRAAAQRMGGLIEDMLELSRVGRVALRRESVNLTHVARHAMAELERSDPARHVDFVLAQGLNAQADGKLVRIVFDNLLGNAWKFTAKTEAPRIEVGSEARTIECVYFVRDNGAGFDMNYAARLFTPFQRLHNDADFPGTGIGLATVHRIIDRHGGRVWAEGDVGQGATIYFTLPVSDARNREERSMPPLSISPSNRSGASSLPSG